MAARIEELSIVKNHYKGKVRDVYDLGDKLLLVTSDRISAYDSVFPNKIDNKGKVLTQISTYFFKNTKHIIQNHFITDEIDKYPQELHAFRTELEFRSMLVKKTRVLPFECIVRGYITGSAWKEYKKSGTVGFVKQEKNLKESQKFDKPIFTPSTKEEEGHDVNISFDEMKHRMDPVICEKIKEISIELYKHVHDQYIEKGLILADTKLEFGTVDGEIYLIDEIFTPDSSRFWDKKKYKIGETPKSYDKQFIRDYIVKAGWDKQPPAPNLPENVISKTYEKYFEAYKILVGDDTKIW